MILGQCRASVVYISLGWSLAPSSTVLILTTIVVIQDIPVLNPENVHGCTNPLSEA